MRPVRRWMSTDKDKKLIYNPLHDHLCKVSSQQYRYIWNGCTHSKTFPSMYQRAVQSLNQRTQWSLLGSKNLYTADVKEDQLRNDGIPSSSIFQKNNTIRRPNTSEELDPKRGKSPFNPHSFKSWTPVLKQSYNIPFGLNTGLIICQTAPSLETDTKSSATNVPDHTPGM